jgi:hypothetical protein
MDVCAGAPTFAEQIAPAITAVAGIPADAVRADRRSLSSDAASKTTRPSRIESTLAPRNNPIVRRHGGSENLVEAVRICHQRDSR